MTTWDKRAYDISHEKLSLDDTHVILTGYFNTRTGTDLE